MTDTLFSQNNEDTSKTNETEISSYVELLVGPGKKFKDLEDLAKGKYESDNKFIPQLQSENRELRDELGKRLTVEEYLRRQTQALEDNSAPLNKENTSASNQPAKPVGVDEREETKAAKSSKESTEDIIELIRKELSKEKTKSNMENNINLVKETLARTWGKDFVSKLQAKADELNISPSFLDEVAAKSPKALLSLVGISLEESGKEIKQHSDATVAPSSSFSASSHRTSETTEGVHNSSYYARLRKENPKLYFSAKTQVQMHNDALRLGRDKFFVS